jgi:putative flavoprotein involved in K+ transport
MTQNAGVEFHDTIVVGAGQAGLATGYHLARQGRDFLILEAHDRVGDVWRHRYDSLRLYSPARYDGLPGMSFPGGWTAPTKDEVADYLEAYAARFDLPVRTGVRVRGLSRGDGDAGLTVDVGDRTYAARNVVVAMGTWRDPHVPDFAGKLDPGILQLHSHAYRNPGQLQPGPALVVGAAHSGADVAFELAAHHQTTLVGRVHGELPFSMEGSLARVLLPIMWFAANHVLTERTPIGRKMQPEVRAGGGPLLRIKLADLRAAGVEHIVDRVVGVEGGKPLLGDGRTLDVANVVWCTGFRNDDSWIEFPVTGADGWPEQVRGASVGTSGLYWVGLPFLYSFSSMLVGGIGRDAERVARQIARAPLASEVEPAPTS